MQLDAPEDNDEYAFINLETQSESQTPQYLEARARRDPKINNFSLNIQQQHDSADYEPALRHKMVPDDEEKEDERGEDEILATLTTERRHILERETEEIPVEEEKSYKNLDDLRISNAKFDSPLRMDLDLVQETVTEFSTPNDKTSIRSVYPMTPSTASRYC